MQYTHVEQGALERFCQQIFTAHGLKVEDANLAARVLVNSDARGIPSHGVARLPRYVRGLKAGSILPNAEARIVHETPLSLVLDAQGGMGTTVSQHAMDAVLAKAREHGAGFATVRDSNHFGIAAWYAMQALPHDLIGIAMTNTAALGVPTHGRQCMFGTNPIAFAAPADKEKAFVLDMSTTAVTRGKLEVYARQETPLPTGWAAAPDGGDAHDAPSLLESMNNYAGGGLHPLGGAGTEFGGHKGYGLAVMVDILCGALAGHGFGKHLHDTPGSTGRVGHFFAAFRIDLFRPADEFREAMDQLLSDLRMSEPAAGHDQVWYAGLKEIQAQETAARHGVPVEIGVIESLQGLGEACGITLAGIKEPSHA
ncbi:Ldh family oxidoreductase [Pseudomonas asuensis]|uniref:Malate dehydrogenase n=1 Tax=Pseudomonas asuensis TaxID=1825787 RepID=A0ABQ2GLN5_9PSED|nr:Ldh family oxidoreductase [Pseudomonas asuensis]GGM00563.1 malate dehydrogenase [Pseudomonas asuensis]